MSEFQYYEFQALDRPLIEREIADIRTHSSRATITNSRFVNHYNYGSFKGDVKKWMGLYFDAFLYVANWGSRRLIFRLPTQAIDLSIVKQYCPGEQAKCWTTETHTFVEYQVEEFEGSKWIPEDNDLLSRLISLRADVLTNDYSLFYLGWLLCIPVLIIQKI